jgi:trafficking protein particle complex subunit 8
LSSTPKGLCSLTKSEQLHLMGATVLSRLRTGAFCRTNALFNAVKKQYGLNTYLLRLALPSQPPPPVAIPAMLPRLPPEGADSQEDGSVMSRTSSSTALSEAPTAGVRQNAISLDQQDIQEIARFVREFVIQALVPWMEKAVTEWNETVGFDRISEDCILTRN